MAENKWATGVVTLPDWSDFNPFEKYARQNGFIFPNFRDENKKCLKPQPSYKVGPNQL